MVKDRGPNSLEVGDVIRVIDGDSYIGTSKEISSYMDRNAYVSKVSRGGFGDTLQLNFVDGKSCSASPANVELLISRDSLFELGENITEEDVIKYLQKKDVPTSEELLLKRGRIALSALERMNKK